MNLLKIVGYFWEIFLVDPSVIVFLSLSKKPYVPKVVVNRTAQRLSILIAIPS